MQSYEERFPRATEVQLRGDGRYSSDELERARLADVQARLKEIERQTEVAKKEGECRIDERTVRLPDGSMRHTPLW